MLCLAASYPKLVKYYGVKRSTYKNVFSSDIEFNSIYISAKGPIRLTLKFAYSLIDPTTSGSLTDDIWNAYSTATLVINSLVGTRVACTIKRKILRGIPAFYRNNECDRQTYE